ncbi:MAG: HAMP domain-containing histidine kinase, partial [Duncaniella sp.]|nr:HAMP domain-containing histidine kinase [Duncaniella sp.]
MRTRFLSLILGLVACLVPSAVLADVQTDFNNAVKAYNSQMAAHEYASAARSAAKAVHACMAARNYDGGLKLLSGMEKTMAERDVTPDSLPIPYYYTAKARFDIYDALKNNAQAEVWLRKMGQYARKANSRDIATDMLFTEAKYYYAVGNVQQGDHCIARLIKQYENSTDYSSADKAYKELISQAVSSGDALLVDRTYDQYMRWSDSIEAANEASELQKAKSMMEEADETIAQKDSTIAKRTSLMTIFIALFGVAVGVLAVGTYFYQRIRRKNRRMAREKIEAEQRSAEKSAMMQNMSSSIEPALERLGSADPDNSAVDDIRRYVRKVEEFSEVDSAPAVPVGEGMESVNLETFLGGIVDEFRPNLQPGATIRLEGARGFATIPAVEVRKILEHLVDNATKFTPKGGKITVTYKKRSATVSQFIVADSGPGIPVEEREDLFKAFNASRDISDGDGLGLPICAKRAEKIG